MNASHRSTIIAEGIAIRARQMNARQPEMEAATAEWNKWAQDHRDFAKFASDEQFALFDRVNAAF